MKGIPALVAALVVCLGGCHAGAGIEADKATPDPGTSPMTVAAADAGVRWASRANSQIAPGTQVYTGDGQCTANFVFIDKLRNVFVGQAAHCAARGSSEETNGCRADSLPLGTAITFRRGGSPVSAGDLVGRGRLVYSSWITMQQRNESDSAVCSHNDFALVKVDARYLKLVNPSLPFWGGPTDLSTSGSASGDEVFSYGNSSLRAGLAALSPQQGVIESADPAVRGWAHTTTSPRPGIPGDSGSAYLDANGRALGTLSTLGLSIPITNTIGDLNHELTYARAHSGLDNLRLVLGTEPFTGS